VPADGQRIDAKQLIGHRIDEVAGSWYVVDDTGVHDLIHAWLHFDEVGWVRLHTLSGLKLIAGRPYADYRMEELRATVQVKPGTPAPLKSVVGGTVTGVAALLQGPEGFEVGWVVETSCGAVAIADIGDDLAIGAWPDRQRWGPIGITLAAGGDA
jgi:hypothetical protein